MYLDQNKGFFSLVGGGQIRSACSCLTVTNMPQLSMQASPAIIKLVDSEVRGLPNRLYILSLQRTYLPHRKQSAWCMLNPFSVVWKSAMEAKNSVDKFNFRVGPLL